MSHLIEMSNITTRANNQFPRPDFHRLDKQPYRLQPFKGGIARLYDLDKIVVLRCSLQMGNRPVCLVIPRSKEELSSYRKFSTSIRSLPTWST